MEYADLLTQPFSSVAVNWNARTGIHFDYGDFGLCVVIALGDFQGGHLCLRGVNIAVELKRGEVLVFDSNVVPHFNLSKEGARHSLVFYMDKSLKKWLEVGNGWTDKNKQ
jgi:hypothetical protein